jgi:hypothetical protein
VAPARGLYLQRVDYAADLTGARAGTEKPLGEDLLPSR